MGKSPKRKCYPLHIARMQEYDQLRPATLCKSWGIPIPTLDDLESVEVITKTRIKDRTYHLGRIKFFVENLIDDRSHSILLGGGGTSDHPVQEPWLVDGRHRYLAAILLDRSTIYSRFCDGTDVTHRSYGILPPAVIDYLRGETDDKPTTKRLWQKLRNRPETQR